MKELLIFSILNFLVWNLNAQSKVKINPILIEETYKFDSISLKKLNNAVGILKVVLNSKEFEDSVLNETFKIGNNNLSSSEIFEIIISGQDNYKNKRKDYSIDLRLSIFDNYAGSNNFGFTNMNTRITRTHRCYIINNETKCYVSHLSHEYMHQIGFYDKRTWLFGKKTESVPYKMGRIIDSIINNDKKCLAKRENYKRGKCISKH